jgi:hypothetical protein
MIKTIKKRLMYFTGMISFLTLLFFIIYLILHIYQIDFVDNSDFDCFYFALSTSTATGFGDIVPKSNVGKIFVCLHMFLFWSIFIIFTTRPDITF